MNSIENVFVLGLDDRNLALLHELPHLKQYRFHSLLSKEELMGGEVELAEYLEKAQEKLDAFDGSVDAIIGYWDFPVSSMVPILCERHGLHGPSLQSVVKCENKYWSRLEQQEVTDAHPRFALVDVEHPELPDLRFPFWLKPVKSFSSALAFRIDGAEEFEHAVEKTRGEIGMVGGAFEYLLSMLDLPPEIDERTGQMCVAEEEVRGRQLTVEGYSDTHGEPNAYGVIDSVCYEGSTSFLRYQYPSSLPQEVADRACDIAVRVIRQIGLSSSTFNIEFFWDPDRDALNILEVNPRLSQSHAPLFEYVDGVPNYQSMVRLALGRDPQQPSGQGEHAVAAKWYYRTFGNALVRSVPSEEDVARVREEMPGTIVDIVANEGEWLSDLPAQDSYSYELAAIYLGGSDEEDLVARYNRALELLPFELEEEPR
ncbi:ATP-grasp domain-containing protein [Saccharopolyspora erythraea]|nr:ATP-grasp domain-containing protein [Saccharopolyspora erythraea]